MDAPSLQEIFSPQSICFGCGPANAKGLRIRSIVRGDEVLAEATSTLACVDRQGKPQAIPDWFLSGPQG